MSTADGRGIAFHYFRAGTVPGTADLITWRIGVQGFDMHLTGEVPHQLTRALEAERLRNDRGGILRGEPADAYQLWAVHPGGRTILDAVERGVGLPAAALYRSEEHTSELQSLMRISYAVFCLKKKT